MTQITIDRDTITTLVTYFAGLTDQAHDRTGDFVWSASGESASVTAGLAVTAGTTTFQGDLPAALADLSTNLADRVQTVYQGAYTLDWGLYRVLQDSAAVESLNVLTAEQWTAFVPTDGAPTTGGGSTSGAG